MSESHFFHVFEQKVLMSEFCSAFSFNYIYYWSWVVGTANINFVLNIQRKLLHSLSTSLCLGCNYQSQIFKWGGGGGIGEFKELLPHIFAWRASYDPCQKCFVI